MIENEKMKVFDIKLKEIFSDSDFNCRGRILPIDVVDLARSIEQIGLQEPIIIQPYEKKDYKYRIVVGHRRYAASIILDKETIPCIIKHDLDEMHARLLNLEENLKREDLNMLQEAKAILPFMLGGWNNHKIAQEIGVADEWVKVRTIILELPTEIQKEVSAGFLNQKQIKALEGKAVEDQYELVRRIKISKLGGERVKIPLKKNTAPSSKKIRNKEEIWAKQDFIYEQFGDAIQNDWKLRFGVRCLAWATGQITEEDINNDINKMLIELNKNMEVPA